MKALITFALFGIVFGISSCTYKETEQEMPVVTLCDSLNVTYSGDIQEIISVNCNMSGCHDGTFPEFISYQGLKDYVDNGKINQRVLVDKNMPPSAPLADSLLAKIQCWIEEGAPNN